MLKASSIEAFVYCFCKLVFQVYFSSHHCKKDIVYKQVQNNYYQQVVREVTKKKTRTGIQITQIRHILHVGLNCVLIKNNTIGPIEKLQAYIMGLLFDIPVRREYYGSGLSRLFIGCHFIITRLILKFQENQYSLIHHNLTSSNFHL